jgi:hypothetical protein
MTMLSIPVIIENSPKPNGPIDPACQNWPICSDIRSKRWATCSPSTKAHSVVTLSQPIYSRQISAVRARARGARTRRRPPYKNPTLVQIPSLHHAPPPLCLPPLAAAAASAPLQVRSRRSTSLLRHLHSSQASPHACLLAPGAGESVDLAWLAATGSLLGRASVGVVGCGLFCVCVNSSF